MSLFGLPMRRLHGCLLVCASLFAATTGYASSHREAPLISQDPLADNTDVYAFKSPDDPNTITIIANYIPFESPDGAPDIFMILALTFGTKFT